MTKTTIIIRPMEGKLWSVDINGFFRKEARYNQTDEQMIKFIKETIKLNYESLKAK